MPSQVKGGPTVFSKNASAYEARGAIPFNVVPAEVNSIRAVPPVRESRFNKEDV
jgi:hypothetical protein